MYLIARFSVLFSFKLFRKRLPTTCTETGGQTDKRNDKQTDFAAVLDRPCLPIARFISRFG